ncbi:hypothetical protein L486_07044 [Kwoniella mangroviensis CBS 10435]|uniref:Large ribosomal subunit protein mL46 N-terminal domain-containing protein n=1 Tax=Kwoniella mangroviensis CBS 10435 TaxID=1331196 RepID=A0A1B9IJL8_9TREE|nr:uncharacterized protein I203_07706 [Kwoniella mangroviensis CBS 8507]OCF55560.1 hypothetical protein L486_07044 [Kwoniella mangroviensis CBS 10435]OCF63281.1 hypothetical protein I203_07706 [Kwoniella mangroviensis CBS 8507]
MSIAPRSLIRPSSSFRRAALQRFSSSSSSSPSSSSNPPPLIASLLLSRAPLLTPTPTELEKTYYDYSRSIKHSLSSPLPTEFYFKSGSLPLRRYLKAEHEYETEIYGERLAGGKPDNIGDIPPETEYEILPRNHWEEKDEKEGKGEKSLERYPEEEVYCLLQSKDKKKWVFPSTTVERLQSLDEAINDNIIGPNGQLDGKGMDSWLVTRKPVGVVREGEQRTFFLRGHILAGQPTLTSSSIYTSHAWLNVREIEDRLRKQGDEKIWESVKGMFGIPEQEVEES